jgi:hypothetical protein
VKVHPITLTPAELSPRDGLPLQVRIPVTAKNSTMPVGSFFLADLETGRGKESPGVTIIRARCRFRYGARVVSILPAIYPGDAVRATVKGWKRPRLFKVVQVHGRRVRDVRGGDGFQVEAWSARHGRAALERNPWVWCLVLAPLRAR